MPIMMLPDRSILKGQKLVENANIEMRHFGWFSNNVDNSNLIFSSILPCLIYYYVFVYYCIILVFYHHFQGKAALTSFALNRWMVALHDKGHFTFIIVAEAVEVCISPGFPRYIDINIASEASNVWISRHFWFAKNWVINSWLIPKFAPFCEPNKKVHIFGAKIQI